MRQRLSSVSALARLPAATDPSSHRGPALPKFPVRDPPEDYPGELNRSPGRRDAPDLLLVSSPPSRANGDTVPLGEDVLNGDAQVGEDREHTLDVSLDPLRPEPRARRMIEEVVGDLL